MTTAQPPQLKSDATPKASRPKRASSPAAVILLYFIFVFLGAALISPRLYASAQFLESVSYRFSFIADAPFHRFVSRSLILLAIVALPWLLKNLGLNSASVLGLKWSGRHCAESILGFGWSFVALALLAAILVTCEARVLETNLISERWWRHLKNASISALLVGVLEELLFRGALFGALRQRSSFLNAALLSSAVYALLHFLEKPDYTARWVHWNSGLTVLAQMLGGFANFHAMIPAFLNLMLVGCLLALLFERTGSLLPSIGLHAGLVFWMKTLNFISNPTKPTNAFWGTEKVTDAWLTTILLVLIFILIERTVPPRKPAAT